MKRKQDILDTIVERFGVNVPVLTTDIEAAFPDLPRRTLFAQIASLVESGELARYESGVYFVPTQSLAGQSTLDPAAVIERKYIMSDGEVCGYWSGAVLDNSSGISMQVPSRLEVVTNNTSTAQRTVKAGNWAECVVKKARLPINASNVRAFQVLDVLTRRRPSEMDEVQQQAFASLASGLSASELYELSLAWPQKVTRRITEGVACGVLA